MDFQLQGKAYHPVIRTAAELRRARELEATLWVAVSAPRDAFRMDPRFLHFLDEDGDGRISTRELREAIDWTFALLEDVSGVDTGLHILEAGRIRADHPEGNRIREWLRGFAGEASGADLSAIRARAALQADLPPEESAGEKDAVTAGLAEKLCLFQGLLLEFANNFISFPMLYDPGRRAAFEEGSLILDGRRFNLALRVPDRAAYLGALDGSTMFIMIVRIEHPAKAESREVAVPATSGRRGNLRVGKHGIFQHVDGTEWFATVVHICDNPVSLTEAMCAPFGRLGAALTRKVESITQAAEKNLDLAAERIGPAAAPPVPANTPQMLAGGGIALAAMGSSLAFMTKTFSGLTLSQTLGGLLLALLAVLVPVMIIAALRLSRRDLSVLLEGAGWAVNSNMRLSRAQRHAFTARASLPPGSRKIRSRGWWLSRWFWGALLTALLSRLADWASLIPCRSPLP